jgi:hypothetical protein
VVEITNTYARGNKGPSDQPRKVTTLNDVQRLAALGHHDPSLMHNLSFCLVTELLKINSTNVMTLEVMNELGLTISRPYRNVQAMDSHEV